MGSPSPSRQSRWILGLLAFGYSIFAVYGSLVPLAYTPVPWERALERFRAIPFLQLGIGSRADWVANLLLFVPLAFLWLGWLWRGPGSARVAISVLVGIGAVALSVGIEFAQIFFPPRTVSQNDILAESIGALVGILIWWWRGPALWTWAKEWREARGVASVAEYLLWTYLAGLFAYGVLPLDLTISPVEIYHKWKDGGIRLIPFTYPVEGGAQLAYGLAADMVLWIPVSLLWVVSGRRSPSRAFLWTLGAAFALEFFQFFVYSRVSDATDLITAAVGAGVGALIGARSRRGDAAALGGAGGGGRRRLLPWMLLAAACWVGLLCLVFWYPYDFNTQRAFLRERLPGLARIPFSAYYWGTEFRAVTEVFHKLLFFAPLGALLAAGRLQIGRFSPLRTLYDGLAVLLMLAVPAIVELGQVALPGKYPDSTDWFLEAVGALAGFLTVIVVRDRMLLAAKPLRPRQRAIRNDGALTRRAER